MGQNHISQNRLDRPFDLTSDRVDFNPNATCDDLDGLDTNEVTGGALNNAVRSIDVVNNGKTFFVLDGFGQLGKFNAVNPNDVDDISNKVKMLLDSGNLREELGKAAYEKSKESVSYTHLTLPTKA